MLLFINYLIGAAYDKLYGQVSLTLDQQVNNTVARDMLVDSTSYIQGTKTDLIIDYLRDGAVSILKRWPEFKTKLHMCLNMPLPSKLQSIAWTFFLSDSQGCICVTCWIVCSCDCMVVC